MAATLPFGPSVILLVVAIWASAKDQTELKSRSNTKHNNIIKLNAKRFNEEGQGHKDIQDLKMMVNSGSSVGPPQKCMCGITNNKRERIVGGEIAAPNEFPWQVGLKDIATGKIFCGATIINDQWLLTASHCLAKRDVNNTIAILGEHEYSKEENSKSFAIKLIEMIQHVRYQAEGFHNDIALLKLEQAVPFTPIALPPCFPKPGIDYTGKTGLVSGWGKLGEDAGLSSILRKLEVPVISLKECREIFEGQFTLYDSVLCAYHKEGGKDACGGDSGGPLVWENSGRWYLIGVVSWGQGCARAGVPAAYTRVDKYYKWISQLTNGSVGCTD